MKVQPFIIFGKTERVALAASLMKDLDAWATEWIAGKGSLDLKIEPVGERFSERKSLDATIISSQLEAGWAICQSDPGKIMQIGSSFLANGGDASFTIPPNGMICEVVRLAILDLVHRFIAQGTEVEFTFGEEGPLEALLPAGAFAPGREAICLLVGINGVSLLIWVPAEAFLSRLTPAVANFPDEVNEIVKLHKAVSNQRLNAWVTLGWAELTVKALADLKVGDVIRLDKDLQETLLLEIEKSTASFSGYLGQQGDNLVFQVDSFVD